MLKEFGNEHPPTARWLSFSYFGVDGMSELSEVSGGDIVNIYDRKHCVSRYLRKIADVIDRSEADDYNMKQRTEELMKRFPPR